MGFVNNVFYEYSFAMPKGANQMPPKQKTTYNVQRKKYDFPSA